ncbi:MAG: hypothetical protein HC767_04990 [Akkermansiaceae bacterium]|nr:hypothetical protein [Akkermansiaceae bacterium]
MQGQGTTGEQGNFTPSPVAMRLISTADVLDIVQNSPNDSMIIDVRGIDEYNGASPYGSGAPPHPHCKHS